MNILLLLLACVAQLDYRSLVLGQTITQETCITTSLECKSICASNLGPVLDALRIFDCDISCGVCNCNAGSLPAYKQYCDHVFGPGNYDKTQRNVRKLMQKKTKKLSRKSPTRKKSSRKPWTRKKTKKSSHKPLTRKKTKKSSRKPAPKPKSNQPQISITDLINLNIAICTASETGYSTECLICARTGGSCTASVTSQIFNQCCNLGAISNSFRTIYSGGFCA